MIRLGAHVERNGIGCHSQPNTEATQCTRVIWLWSLILLCSCQPTTGTTEQQGQAPPSEQSGTEKTTSSSRQLSYPQVRSVGQTGCCDGSAGVAINNDYFLVGNDEDSVVYLYHRNQPANAVRKYNLRKFLDLKKKDDESDIEGMTRIGSTVYLIASHARSKDGDKRKGRRQLFALRVNDAVNPPTLTPFGQPYTKLLKDLENVTLSGLDFEKAAKRAGDTERGLNIEGLAASDSGSLLIGFRYPIHLGKTIIIELLNPETVVQGSSPTFGQKHQLVLGGMGIRGFEQFNGTFLLTAESPGGKGRPHVFSWDGQSDRPRRVFGTLPKNANPESILIFPNSGLSEIHLLSDDGNEEIGNKPCNELKDENQRRYRRFILSTNR